MVNFFSFSALLTFLLGLFLCFHLLLGRISFHLFLLSFFYFFISSFWALLSRDVLSILFFLFISSSFIYFLLIAAP